MLKIRAVLYNWKTADQIDAEFFLNNRPKGAENPPGTQSSPFTRYPTSVDISQAYFKKLFYFFFSADPDEAF